MESLFDKRIWRTSDVAEYLGVTKGHIYNLCSRREIPYIRKRGLLYFVPHEIENWLTQGD